MVSGMDLPSTKSEQKKKLFRDSCSYIWDKPYLFKQGVDRIFRRFILAAESKKVLKVSIHHLMEVIMEVKG